MRITGRGVQGVMPHDLSEAVQRHLFGHDIAEAVPQIVGADLQFSEVRVLADQVVERPGGEWPVLSVGRKQIRGVGLDARQVPAERLARRGVEWDVPHLVALAGHRQVPAAFSERQVPPLDPAGLTGPQAGVQHQHDDRHVAQPTVFIHRAHQGVFFLVGQAAR